MRLLRSTATPGDDERGLQLFNQLDRGKMLEDFLAAAQWLKARPDRAGKIASIGFVYGGGVSNQLAVRMGTDLLAAVPFYGVQPNATDAARIKAPVLAHYGELDTRITSGWPAGANHGFHNDTTPRYDEAAAKLACSARSIGSINI